MKLTLEFTLPEEQAEAALAQNAGLWRAAVQMFAEELRRILKHGDEDEAARTQLERARSMLFDILNAYELSLDEERPAPGGSPRRMPILDVRPHWKWLVQEFARELEDETSEKVPVFGPGLKRARDRLLHLLQAYGLRLDEDRPAPGGGRRDG